MRISLRQLLLMVTAVALAIVSLKTATPWWQAGVGLVLLLLFFAAVIAAIFDRGPRQAFAIGFAIVVLGYAMMIAGGHRSVSPNGNTLTYRELEGVGYLPTTVILGELYDVLYREGGGRTGRPTAGSPSQSDFARTGHAWWALLLGYLGGCFAQFVYRRRMKESTASTAKS